MMGKLRQVEPVSPSLLRAALRGSPDPAPGCTARRRGAALVPPRRGEGRLAEQGRRKEQPGAWDDSAGMWG